MHPKSFDNKTPETLATPEGDNENVPGQPLEPSQRVQRPRGNEPHPSQPIRPALSE